MALEGIGKTIRISEHLRVSIATPDKCPRPALSGSADRDRHKIRSSYIATWELIYTGITLTSSTPKQHHEALPHPCSRDYCPRSLPSESFQQLLQRRIRRRWSFYQGSLYDTRPTSYQSHTEGFLEDLSGSVYECYG